jgi:predicted GIY-YIG superfamily endonuclease
MEKIKQHLYRHFDEWDNLLYVGISLSTIQRLSQHKNQSHWFNSISKVTIEQFPSRREALEAERIEIQKQQPLHNLTFKKHHNFKIRITEDKRENSRVGLVNEIVTYKPMYSFEDAAHVLGVGTSKIKEWCEMGKLGYVVISKRWNSRYNKWSLKKGITGWQILDYIENLEIMRQLDKKGGENASVQ